MGLPKKKTTSSKPSRLQFQLNVSVMERLIRAAEISGQSLNDFVASAATREADQVLAQHELITLSNEDRDFFLSILDDDSEPSARSVAAAQRYRESQCKGSDYPC